MSLYAPSSAADDVLVYSQILLRLTRGDFVFIINFMKKA